MGKLLFLLLLTSCHLFSRGETVTTKSQLTSLEMAKNLIYDSKPTKKSVEGHLQTSLSLSTNSSNDFYFLYIGKSEKWTELDVRLKKDKTKFFIILKFNDSYSQKKVEHFFNLEKKELEPHQVGHSFTDEMLYSHMISNSKITFIYDKTNQLSQLIIDSPKL